MEGRMLQLWQDKSCGQGLLGQGRWCLRKRAKQKGWAKEESKKEEKNDEKKQEKNGEKEAQKEPEKKRRDDIECFNCHKTGHFANKCPEKRETNGFVDECDEGDADLDYITLTEENDLCGLMDQPGEREVASWESPSSDLAKVLVPVTWGVNKLLNIWSIFDTGTLMTLADPSVFEELEGEVITTHKVLKGIGSKTTTVTKQKIVVARVASRRADVVVSCCELGMGRILLGRKDGETLGITVTGIPVTSARRQLESEPYNDDTWASDDSDKKEEKHADDDVIRRIEAEIEKAM